MSLMTLLLAAFLTGLAGSGHCAAMCGGIAIGLARMHGTSPMRGMVGAVLSSGGRLLGYALAGALVAAATQTLGVLVHAEQLRSLVAWTGGIALVLVGLRMTGVLALRGLDAVAARVWRKLTPLVGLIARVPRGIRPLAAGMLWGWLPCGMAYAMLAVAATTADPGRAALVMLAFGLGTLPALVFTAGFAGLGAAGAAGPRVRLAGGVLLVCFGLAGIASSALYGEPDHVHGAHAAASLSPAPARTNDAGALASRT